MWDRRAVASHTVPIGTSVPMAQVKATAWELTQATQQLRGICRYGLNKYNWAPESRVTLWGSNLG